MKTQMLRCLGHEVSMIIPSTFGSRIYDCPVTLHCLESDSLKHLSQDVAMGSVATLLSSVRKVANCYREKEV